MFVGQEIPPAPFALARDNPAVHIKRLPRDIAGARRRQKGHHRRDIFRVVGPLERNDFGPATLHLFNGRALLLRPNFKIRLR